MANWEKLQPQRKITKKGYSPKERKERAGSGTELLAGLGGGTAVLAPRQLHTQARRLAGTCSPHQPRRAVHPFPLSQKEGCSEYPWSRTHVAGFVALLACEFSRVDVHTVAVGTRPSPEKAAGSPSWADSSNPRGAAAHLETSRSISSRKRRDSVKCHFFLPHWELISALI